MEFLKELLGEELYKQVQEKLEGNEEVKLVNLKSGEYVSKRKYEDLEVSYETLKNDLSKRSKDLEKLKKESDLSEESKIKIDELQKKYDEDTNALNEKLLQNKINSYVDLEIIKQGCIDPVGAKAHLTEFIRSASYDDKSKTVNGLHEQINSLKESQKHLFGEIKDLGGRHFDPPKKELTPEEQVRKEIFGK